MSDKKKKTPPTVITLTLPTPEDGGIAPERATATLLIQRGDLAHVKQFHYAGYLPDMMEAIREATEALGVLADNPPVVPDPPAEKPKSKPKKGNKAKAEAPSAYEEPTIDVPLKKGTKAVKISHIKIVGGESDAVAYRQAITIAGRLIDGGLWDGESQIRFDDVYATAKKIKGLSDKEIGSLFTLRDFVTINQLGEFPSISFGKCEKSFRASTAHFNIHDIAPTPTIKPKIKNQNSSSILVILDTIPQPNDVIQNVSQTAANRLVNAPSLACDRTIVSL